MTRVQELLLGPLPVHGVTTRMPTGRGGVFASRAAHASVGTGVLKGLDVTFDYSQRRVLLAPDAHHRQPDPVDHSGLWLSQGEGVFEVEHVSADSSASAAGLRTGDQVLAVDGQAASQILLPELRQRWAAAGPGLAITLTIAATVDAVTAAQTRQRRLKLQDRLAPGEA